MKIKNQDGDVLFSTQKRVLHGNNGSQVFRSTHRYLLRQCIDLSGRNLRNIDVNRLDFSDGDFSGVDLRRSNLSYCSLNSVNFTNADLREVDFSGASLIDVNFSGANLEGANLFGATIERSTFTDSTNTKYINWPFDCSSIGVNCEEGLATQLAYHFCGLKCSSREFLLLRKQVLSFANKFHRSNLGDLIGELRPIRIPAKKRVNKKP